MKSKKFWMSWSKRGWPETIDGSGWILQGFHRRRVYAEVSAIKTVCYSLVTRNWTPSSSFQKQERSPYLTKTQLLVALYYLATDMSQASVCRSIKRVTRAITTIAPRYIRFPSPAEETTAMQEFSVIVNMPCCIGCIDGTLIPIRGPGGDDAELYRCRKDCFAYNVMAGGHARRTD
ncbi:nuclease HARBI1-like 5, partial [Homarus americanus]